MGCLQHNPNVNPMPRLIEKQATRVPRNGALFIAVFVIVAGGGCGDSTPTAPANAAPLVGTAWRLVSLEPGAPLVSAAPPGRDLTLRFDRLLAPARLWVGAGGPCNGYSGLFYATPEGVLWIESPLLGTRIGCEGDRGALEAAYLDRLYATATWLLRADSLVLRTPDARWLLFVRQ
jgi:heat shock protein HslJ